MTEIRPAFFDSATAHVVRLGTFSTDGQLVLYTNSQPSGVANAIELTRWRQNFLNSLSSAEAGRTFTNEEAGLLLALAHERVVQLVDTANGLEDLNLALVYRSRVISGTDLEDGSVLIRTETGGEFTVSQVGGLLFTHLNDPGDLREKVAAVAAQMSAGPAGAAFAKSVEGETGKPFVQAVLEEALEALDSFVRHGVLTVEPLDVSA